MYLAQVCRAGVVSCRKIVSRKLFVKSSVVNRNRANWSGDGRKPVLDLGIPYMEFVYMQRVGISADVAI